MKNACLLELKRKRDARNDSDDGDPFDCLQGCDVLDQIATARFEAASKEAARVVHGRRRAAGQLVIVAFRSAKDA